MFEKIGILILFFLITHNGFSSELLKDISIYPLGGVSHFKPKPATNETAKYIAISKTINNDNGWQFENGVGTFKDSYHQRAYMVFSNISHENYRYGIFTPMLNLHCAYKGHTYKSDDRRLQCFPPFKLRIGKSKGLFVNIMPVPKIKGLTNGLVAFELGYKF